MEPMPIRSLPPAKPLIRSARIRKDPQQERGFAETFDKEQAGGDKDDNESDVQESPLQRTLQDRATQRRQPPLEGEHQLDVMA